MVAVTAPHGMLLWTAVQVVSPTAGRHGGHGARGITLCGWELCLAFAAETAENTGKAEATQTVPADSWSGTGELGSEI